ncbi:hypothetical protein HaLaN_11566 [Haematococcus lacustris]|uniref:Uncharacterized protein n=1 Tax=Haematococcus lacustris TaxID=44745 RepID=A0A699Z7U9_HAELA|nr:hypothetical protein HaLaN_11566 [Haematococcus lacustris]
MLQGAGDSGRRAGGLRAKIWGRAGASSALARPATLSVLALYGPCCFSTLNVATVAGWAVQLELSTLVPDAWHVPAAALATGCQQPWLQSASKRRQRCSSQGWRACTDELTRLVRNSSTITSLSGLGSVLGLLGCSTTLRNPARTAPAFRPPWPPRGACVSFSFSAASLDRQDRHAQLVRDCNTDSCCKDATARLNAHRVMVKEKRKGTDKHKRGPPKKPKGARPRSLADCELRARLAQLKASNDRRAGMAGARPDVRSGVPALFVSPHCLCPRIVHWPVIKVPESAVLRGCKKTKRKLREHLRLRAEVHSQLRVIASLFVLRIFLTCLVGYPSPGYLSAPEPPAVQPPPAPDAPPLPPLPPRAPAQPAPAQPASMESDITQPTPRRSSARLAALAPAAAAPSGPPVPLDCEDPVMLRQLKEFCEFYANTNFKTVYNQLQRRLVRPKQRCHPMLVPVFQLKG